MDECNTDQLNTENIDNLIEEAIDEVHEDCLKDAEAEANAAGSIGAEQQRAEFLQKAVPQQYTEPQHEEAAADGTAREKTGISLVFRILMITAAVMAVISGTLAFVVFSGLADNVITSVKADGFSFNSVWRGLTGQIPAAEEEKEKDEHANVIILPENTNGGNVYVKDNVVYIRADIEVNDDDIVDSEDPAYRVCVNLACQCVTVYKIMGEGKEVPVRVFPCSTARDGNETPEGRFPLGETYDWCFLEDGSYAQYAMRISGDLEDEGYMIHTVPYTKKNKGSLEWYEYNKLGSEASLGCIRIPAGDMYWLREHVSSGGEILIYSDKNNPGALGMPAKYYIPEEVTRARGWDPTDPDSKNPWHSYDLTLSVPDSITVKASDEGLDITKYVSAVDIYDNDLSKYITYENGTDKYGFSFTTNNYNDPDEYTDAKGNVDIGALIEYHNTDMDISIPGSYVINVGISIGPISASRTIFLNVIE